MEKDLTKEVEEQYMVGSPTVRTAKKMVEHNT